MAIEISGVKACQEVASEKPYDEGRDAACDGESKQPGEYDV